MRTRNGNTSSCRRSAISWVPRSSGLAWIPKSPKLSGQLEARKLLERAKGILQRDLGITEQGAHLKLQQESRRRRIPMNQVAEAVVLSGDLRRVEAGQ